MIDELKPGRCGCGGEANIHKDDGTFGQMPIYTVSCNTCGMRSGRRSTEVQAVTAWNRAIGIAEKSSTVERTAKLEHTYQVGENWYCENCGQQLNAYDWETPQNFVELGNENTQVSEVTSQNNEGTWQKTERTAKVFQSIDGYRCDKCFYRFETTAIPQYCPHCGARLEWE